MAIRKYPSGATHCVYPGHHYDEIYFRVANSGEYLEYFNMNRHEWVRNVLHPMSWLNTIHKLEDPDAVNE